MKKQKHTRFYAALHIKQQQQWEQGDDRAKFSSLYRKWLHKTTQLTELTTERLSDWLTDWLKLIDDKKNQM